MLRWAPLATLLLAGLVHAHPAVDTLLQGPLAPDVAAAAIDTLVSADLEPDALRPLFAPGLHRSVPVAGAQVVQRRLAGGSTAEATLAWNALLGSKHYVLAHDPDVFERLLLGLQQADPSVLAGLPGHEPSGLAEQAWQQLHDNLLSPLRPGIDWQAPSLRLSTAAWAEALLARDQPLVRLQTDSGDAAFRLLEDLQVQAITSIIRDGTEAEARVALEAWKQRFVAWKEPWQAGSERLLLSEEPEPPGPPEPQLLRARTDLSGVSVDGDFLVATRGLPISPWWLLGLLPVLWLAALRVAPGAKKILFPIGAIGVGVGVLLAAEGALFLAGVDPLITARADLFSYRAEPVKPTDRVFVSVGSEHVTLEVGGARFRAFSREPTGPRIVVVGESSAHGSNHLAEDAFAGRLEQSLGVEVINAGIGGAVSDEILAVGTQALEWKPDVLLIYFGFNDLSRLAYMASLNAYSPRVMRARALLDRSRLVAVLARVVPADLLQFGSGDAFEAPILGMHHDSKIQEMHAIAEHHAARNMRRLILAAGKHGVDVVVAIQAINEDTCPPDATMASDPEVCVAERLHAIAVEAAAGTQATVVDIPAALRAHADGPAGHPYFWDGVHPSRLGHAVIAKALEPTLKERIR